LTLRFQAVCLLCLVLLFALPACSTVPHQDTGQAQRLQLHELKSDRLMKQTDWSLSGKLAISNGKEGGSGRFYWHRDQDASQMNFHGAMGRGAWRLEANVDGARLELADGTLHHARSVDLLVRAQLGWEIPAESLSWWVRGLVAPGDVSERIFDDQGNLSRLLQDGWTIEFGKYKSLGGFYLPLRMKAQQADWKVKLVVRDWEMAATEPDD
jgi:outer membrane lipoprotein LolB